MTFKQIAEDTTLPRFVFEHRLSRILVFVSPMNSSFDYARKLVETYPGHELGLAYDLRKLSDDLIKFAESVK